MRQPGSARRTAAACSLRSAASASPFPFAARTFATTVSTSAIARLPARARARSRRRRRASSRRALAPCWPPPYTGGRALRQATVVAALANGLARVAEHERLVHRDPEPGPVRDLELSVHHLERLVDEV